MENDLEQRNDNTQTENEQQLFSFFPHFEETKAV